MFYSLEEIGPIHGGVSFPDDADAAQVDGALDQDGHHGRVKHQHLECVCPHDCLHPTLHANHIFVCFIQILISIYGGKLTMVV